MRVLIDCRMYNGNTLHGLARRDYMTIKELAALKPEWEFGALLCTPCMDDLTSEYNNISTVLTKARPFTLREHCELPKIIADWHPAVYNATSIAVPCRIPGRYVVTVPDLTMYHYPRTFLDRWYHKLILAPVLRKARRVAVYCEDGARDVSENLGIDRSKIDLVYQGADASMARPTTVEQRARTREKFAIKDTPYILCVTNPKIHKNLPRFLQAWEEFKRIDHKNYQLVVVSSMAPWLSERLKGGLNEVRVLSGISDEDLRSLYQDCDFLAFPSLSEGFGLPAVEAMSVGKPVLAANTTSLPEVVGEAGLLCDPFSIEDMARKISVLVNDRQLYDNLKIHCLPRANQFTWKMVAQRHVDCYMKAIADP